MLEVYGEGKETERISRNTEGLFYQASGNLADLSSRLPSVTQRNVSGLEL